MKKFIITESEKRNILGMYGLLKEQTYMENYPGDLLDFCGYRAIEKFEETMGNTQGGSMGEKYFEKKIQSFDTKIKSNLTTHIGIDTFNKFPNKLKMQIWSWMFNSTDASDGTIKYIAGLGQAINYPKYSGETEGQAYRIKVMKVGSPEYKRAISEIKNYSVNFDELYNNYVLVLDQQYKSTAENNNAQGSYDNSWKYRPTNLTTYYNECNPSETSDEKNDEQSPKETETTTDTNDEQEKSGAIFRGKTLGELLKQINNGELVDEATNGFDLSKPIKVNFQDGNYYLQAPGGSDGFYTLKLVLNVSSDHKNKTFPSKDSLLSKGYEVWDEGTFQLSGEGIRDWALMYK